MGFLEFLKRKKKEERFPEKKELEIPPAPPTAEELPAFPTPEEIPKPKVKEITKPPIPTVEKLEEGAVREEKELLEEREELALKKPIFVSLESFRDMLDEIGLVTNLLKENEDTLVRVSEFKEDEDKEFKKWESQISDIQKKLIYADKTLFGAK